MSAFKIVYNIYFEINFDVKFLNFMLQIFHHVAYKAKSCEDLLSGIDEFLDNVTVLPPGEWDPNIRIEPPKSVPSQVRVEPVAMVTSLNPWLPH